MKDEKNTYELPKEYFLKEVSSFLKGTGFNKYILNNDRERFLPDMFLKDSLKKKGLSVPS